MSAAAGDGKPSAIERKLHAMFRAPQPKGPATKQLATDITGGFGRVVPAVPEKRRRVREAPTPVAAPAPALVPAPAPAPAQAPTAPAPTAPASAPLPSRPLRVWTIRPLTIEVMGDDAQKFYSWLKVRTGTRHSPGGMHGAILHGKAGTGKSRLIEMCCAGLNVERMVIHPWSAASADMIERTAVQSSVQCRKPTAIVIEAAELWALRRQARSEDGGESSAGTFSFEHWTGGMPIILVCCDMSLRAMRELERSGKWKVFRTTPFRVQPSMVSNMVAAVSAPGSNPARFMRTFDGDVRNLLVRSRVLSHTGSAASASSEITSDYTVFEATKSILGNNASLTKAEAMASADSRLVQYLWWNAPKVLARERGGAGVSALDDLANERELWSKMDATHSMDVRRFAARWSRIASRQDLSTSRIVDIPPEAHWKRHVAKRGGMALDDMVQQRFNFA